jgi:hypothetical protein
MTKIGNRSRVALEGPRWGRRVGAGLLVSVSLLGAGGLWAVASAQMPAHLWIIAGVVLLFPPWLAHKILTEETASATIDYEARRVELEDDALPFADIEGVGLYGRALTDRQGSPDILLWDAEVRSEEGKTRLYTGGIGDVYSVVRRLARTVEQPLEVEGESEPTTEPGGDSGWETLERSGGRLTWRHREPDGVAVAVVVGLAMIGLGIYTATVVGSLFAWLVLMAISVGLFACLTLLQEGRSGHLIQQGQHALALVDGKLEHDRPRLGRRHLDARSTDVILPVDDVWTGVVVADEDDVDVLPCLEEDLAELEAAVVELVEES